MIRYGCYVLLALVVFLPSYGMALKAIPPAESCYTLKGQVADIQRQRREAFQANFDLAELLILIGECQAEASSYRYRANEIYDASLLYFYEELYPRLKINETLFAFIKAQADAGDMQAKLHLSFFYNQGLEVDVDLVKSFALLRETIELLYHDENARKVVPGYNDYMHNLEMSYIHGQGTEKDYTQAMKWFREGVKRDYTPSMRILAVHYINGWGVTKDYHKVFELIHSASKLDDVEAMFFLSSLYFLGIEAFSEPDKEAGVIELDNKQAYRWMKKAAIRGVPKAQFGLSYYYYDGIGTERDVEMGTEWMAAAARNGYGAAQGVIGTIIEQVEQAQEAG